MNGDSTNKTIIICGSARLPKEIAHGGTDRLWIELEATIDDFEIIGFSCTVLSSLSENFLKNELLGHGVEKGIDIAINAIEERFFGTIKKATISALEDVRMSYKKIHKK